MSARRWAGWTHRSLASRGPLPIRARSSPHSTGSARMSRAARRRDVPLPPPAGPGGRERLGGYPMRRGSEREQAAHRYADHGWPVFPAAPDQKIPITEHGYLDATTGHKQIESWWRSEPRANVAVATGKPGPDVLDVDRHKDGTGFPAFNQLKREGLVPEPMAVIRTPS